LCGYEPGLEARLRALCTQDYPAPIQVHCGVRDATDPAAAVIETLAAELPPGSIQLHRDPRLHGRNFKMSKLINMMEHVRHDVLIMVDSDIRVGSDYVGCVVSELQRRNVGVVTCLYTGVPEGSRWAHFAAKGINLQFLPNAILALSLGLARPCFGATIAIRRDTLREIGGLGRFADQLWDDYAIGEAVRAAGYVVAVPAYVVAHVCSDASAGEMFARELRSARTIGRIDRVGHVIGGVTHPFALASLTVLLGGGGPAVTAVMVSLVARAFLAACMTYRFATPTPSWWMLPVRDIAAFVIFLLSFFGGTVVWRGHRYRVRSDGTLLHAPQ
jgi:ceramide glucosyltransferase